MSAVTARELRNGVPQLRARAIDVNFAEGDRLRSLAAYFILDSPAETAFSALADSAASLLGTTRAAITFVDAERQWVKAAHGPSLRSTPRDWSLCSEIVNSERALVITDVQDEPRFAHYPVALGPNGIRCYAGVPIVGRDGLPLGTLSVADEHPRSFSPSDLNVLAGLATAVVSLLEQRRADLEAGRSGHPPLPLGVDSACFSPAGVRKALQRGEVEVHFQPIVSIPDGRLTGVEALARWNMPGVGLIPPQFFLPYVEASPLLSQYFTQHILASSCKQLAAWRAIGAAELRMSVNVTGFDVTGGCLPSMVADAVSAAGVPYECLTLEITETVNLNDRELAINHLDRIRKLGVRVTLDDFGVGYSSLEHAGHLPISGLKLDRDFIAGIGSSPAMAATLDSVVQLCRTLGLELVAEGVETQQTVDTLVSAGVSLAQGYHFWKPASAASISTLIERHSETDATQASDTATVLPYPPARNDPGIIHSISA